MTDAFGRRFIGQAGRIYGLQALGLAGALTTSVLLSRALGPEGKGSVDLFVLLVGLTGELGVLGATYGFIYLLANKRERLAEIHGDAVVASGALGVVGVAIALLAPEAVSVLLGDISTSHAVLGLAIAGFIGYSAAWSGLMYGTDHAPMTYRVQALASIATAFLVGAAVVVDGLSVDIAIALLAFIAVVSACVRFVIALRLHRPDALRPTIRTLSESLRYGLRALPGRVANWLHFRIDLLIISNVVGVGGVGVYAVSVRWAELLWLVGLGVQSAAVHRIASGSAAGTYGFAKRVLFAVLALTTAAGLALALAASPLIGALYGPSFAAAVWPLIVLIPGVIAWDASRVLSNYIALNRGRPTITTVIAVSGAIGNLMANVYTIPRWGINGAAATTTITYTLVLLATAVLFVHLGRQANGRVGATTGGR